MCWSFKILVGLLFAAAAATAHAQDKPMNFAGKRALIMDVSPYVEITSFSWQRRYAGNRGVRLEENFSYRNKSDKAVVALEIVILKYDAFNRNLVGARGTIPGVDSANYTALRPGQTGSDGFGGHDEDSLFTSLIYVRHVRLQDGSVWRADLNKVRSELKRLVPDITDPGEVDPKPPKKDG